MDFNSFFRGDNFLFVFCNKIMDTVLLSILWVFLSIPLITIGPTTAALYFTVVKCLRGGDDHTYRCFWKSFLGNLRAGIPATLIAAAILGLLTVGLEAARQMTATGITGYTLFYIAYYFAAVLPVGVVCYLFPLLGRFSFSVRNLFVTSTQLAVRHLPSTIVIVLLVIMVVNFCLKYPAAIFLVPSLTALVSSLFFERIFQKYIPASLPDTSEDISDGE